MTTPTNTTITVDLDKTNTIGFDSNVQSASITVGDKKYLVLVIDMDVDKGASESGKMNAVANTSGFKDAPAGTRLNLYLGHPVKKSR